MGWNDPGTSGLAVSGGPSGRGITRRGITTTWFDSKLSTTAGSVAELCAEHKGVMMRDNSAVFARGSNTAEIRAMHARVRADKIHKNRSEGQRVRQARERMYGKDSHKVTVRMIGDKA